MSRNNILNSFKSSHGQQFMHGDILELLWKDCFPGKFDYATLNLENVHHFLML
jgi:hypothetical protein